MFCIAPPKHKSMLIVCAVREEKVPIEGQGTCGMFYDTCLFFSPVNFNFKVSVESCCLLLVQFRDSGCGYIPSFLSNTREDDADCFAYFPGELEGFKPVKYTHMLEMEPKYLVPSANSLAGVLVCFGAPFGTMDWNANQVGAKTCLVCNQRKGCRIYQQKLPWRCIIEPLVASFSLHTL